MRKNILLLWLLLFLVFGAIFTFSTTHANLFQVINPSGFIALQERNLIVTAVSLMLLLAIPVLAVMFFIVWKYSGTSEKNKYAPDWTGNIWIKSLWWAILSSYVVLFAFIVWNAAHRLDPYKQLTSSEKPITIQVVALQWKWLFIYPEQHIATVNFVQFPAHTPINFELTADAPMNSFWIPSLGGQIYAMATMETKLHLLSNKTGDFPGGAAEINGEGYAGMRFIARVSTISDFDAWVTKIKKSNNPLNQKTYTELAKPSEDTLATSYSSVDSNLYTTIIMKDMRPTPMIRHVEQ
jgi:cytochrome o ubiquinol oxidase subunit 2